MRIIIEVVDHAGPGQIEVRSFRITLPDNAKLTWQAANPTTHGSSDDNVLRAYVGSDKRQIMAIPHVITWREEGIEVEEYIEKANVVGKSWEAKRDAPLLDRGVMFAPRPIDPVGNQGLACGGENTVIGGQGRARKRRIG